VLCPRMARISPFHLRLEVYKQPAAPTYHCNDGGPVGRSLHGGDRAAGSGGFRMCRECDRLNRRDPGRTD
jgi:hypothetical protein